MNNRKPLIAGNWKMFKTNESAVAAAEQLVELTADIQAVEIMIAPPFTALSEVRHAIRNSSAALGAQNMHWENEGAFTGEISGPMLKSAGCRYVILGHSERRQYFGETDETVRKKISAAMRFDLLPILCVGETAAERENGNTFSVLDKQVRNGLEGVVPGGTGGITVAYEPVWAIGTGKTARVEQAQEVHAFLRSLWESLFGKTSAAAVRILYGGSVKPDNIRELMKAADIDGALVGGASLDPKIFSEIVRRAV